MVPSVECSELLEIIQWMNTEQSFQPDPLTMVCIRKEIDDMMTHLCMPASRFDTDPVGSARSKLAQNANS